jgi:hypothetical protein
MCKRIQGSLFRHPDEAMRIWRQIRPERMWFFAIENLRNRLVSRQRCNVEHRLDSLFILYRDHGAAIGMLFIILPLQIELRPGVSSFQGRATILPFASFASMTRCASRISSKRNTLEGFPW